MKNIHIPVVKGVVLCAMTVVCTSYALGVQAVEYGGFGGRPAFPRPDNARTESIFVHTLIPGQVQDEGVRVVNNTGEAKTMRIYAADSTPSTDGAFACKQYSEAKTDVGAWVALTKSEVTLEPQTSEVVPFTISVPTDASVGEHNGCILIQEVAEDAAPKSGASLSVRTGLRVAITVPGDIERKLEVVGFTLTNDENGRVLHPLVKNTGNVSIDADVRVVTRYAFGLTYAEHGGQYPVLRGDTSEWNFELQKPFWGGLYRSSFVVAYDANAEATVGVVSGKTLTELEGLHIWFVSAPSLPGLAIELIVLSVLAWGAFLLFVAQKRKRWIATAWHEHVVRQGEDLPMLAKKGDVSWKLLAKANKLRAPYTLTVGDVVRVPPEKK